MVLEKPSRVGALGSRYECTRKRGRATSEECVDPHQGPRARPSKATNEAKSRWAQDGDSAHGSRLPMRDVLSGSLEREGRSDESRKLTTGGVESHLEETEGLRSEDSVP